MGFSVGGKNESVKSEPNVVPLCDVLLVLLIIFMIVTPLVRENFSGTLPSAINTISMPDSPEVILSIRKDGSMMINDKEATAANLQTLIEETLLAASDKKLYLKVDQELEFGKLVELIEPIKEAGVQVVGIIAARKTEGGN